MHTWFGVITLVIQITDVVSSVGDRSSIFQNCLERCGLLNCTDDGLNFKSYTYEQPLSLFITQWTCEDECKYECMWETVQIFNQQNWKTPQFYGKWPFIRFFGMQEPASVFFSLLNGFVHLYMMKKFRKDVRANAPLRWLWHIFFIVGVHTWIWSAVFHTRDLPLTELLDYISAFSLVLVNFYMMIVRLLRDKVPNFILLFATFLLITFFIHHVIYLSTRFDYGYNMELNILVGAVTVICWFGWSICKIPKQSYVKKCTIYVTLTSILTLLEIADAPPLLYIIDFHSLWHLFTAPLTVIFYSFGIDDCKYLRKKETEILTKDYKVA